MRVSALPPPRTLAPPPTPTDLIDIRRIYAEPEALASPRGQDILTR